MSGYWQGTPWRDTHCCPIYLRITNLDFLAWKTRIQNKFRPLRFVGASTRPTTIVIVIFAENDSTTSTHLQTGQRSEFLTLAEICDKIRTKRPTTNYMRNPTNQTNRHTVQQCYLCGGWQTWHRRTHKGHAIDLLKKSIVGIRLASIKAIRWFRHVRIGLVDRPSITFRFFELCYVDGIPPM